MTKNEYEQLVVGDFVCNGRDMFMLATPIQKKPTHQPLLISQTQPKSFVHFSESDIQTFALVGDKND